MVRKSSRLYKTNLKHLYIQPCSFWKSHGNDHIIQSNNHCHASLSNGYNQTRLTNVSYESKQIHSFLIPVVDSRKQYLYSENGQVGR